MSGVAEALSPESGSVEPEGGSEIILLVEDDEALRGLILTILQDAGYSVLVAHNAHIALDLIRMEKGTVHLLLPDVVMPKTSGVQLFKLLRASAPELKVILMSGYAAEVVARQAPIPPDVAFIEKPFNKDSLLSKIRTVLRMHIDK